MNLFDIFFNGLIACRKEGYPYRVHLHCNRTNDIDIPDSIRASLKADEIVFVLDSTHKIGDIFYDYDNQEVSFDAYFNGSPYKVVIPNKSLVAAGNELERITITFVSKNEAKKQEKVDPPNTGNNHKGRANLRVVK